MSEPDRSERLREQRMRRVRNLLEGNNVSHPPLDCLDLIGDAPSAARNVPSNKPHQEAQSTEHTRFIGRTNLSVCLC
jgi:hypothetical protein